MPDPGMHLSIMAQIRRWGKEYVDKRNWKEYNESLVRRGEILLDFDLLDESGMTRSRA